MGGRWIFLACEPAAGVFENQQLLGTLQKLALRQNDQFTFRPRVALFLPGEQVKFHFQPVKGQAAQSGDVLKVRVEAGDGTPQSLSFPADASHAVMLPQSVESGKGLHTVEATLVRDDKPIWTYRSGFWMRDLAYLRSGPKLTANLDYFELNGKPLPVVGTTYMAGDVDRQYLVEPNPYVWDEDMGRIHAEGLNMIRTGIWSGWSALTNPRDAMSENALRSVEAFLMTARKYDLPVQFNVFAFLPESFGGGNPYLDPAARQLQDRFVDSIVRRFHDVPFLAWDLVNELSFNENLWKTLPAHTPYEEAAWRRWLAQRYPNRAALLAAWAEPAFGIGRALQAKPDGMPPEVKPADPLALPSPDVFEPDGVRTGANPLKVYDYFLFTQAMFREWVEHQRDDPRRRFRPAGYRRSG